MGKCAVCRAQGVARRILAFHAAGQREATKGAAATVEQSLGLLTALCLRYPDGAAAAAEAGCLEAAMEVRLHCIECDLGLGYLAFCTVRATRTTGRQPFGSYTAHIWKLQPSGGVGPAPACV